MLTFLINFLQGEKGNQGAPGEQGIDGERGQREFRKIVKKICRDLM